MESLIIVSQDDKNIRELKALLEPFHKSFAIEVAPTLMEVARRLAGRQSGAVVYAIEWLSDIEVTRIAHFRTANNETPIVVIARKDSKIAIENLKAISWAIHVEVPFSVTYVQQIIRRLIDHKEMRLPAHKRYSTETNGWLESGPQKVTVKVLNLSMGGACCVTSIQETWLPGTVVQLRVILSDIGRERVMKAFIIWSKKDETTQTQTLGLQFRAS